MINPTVALTLTPKTKVWKVFKEVKKTGPMNWNVQPVITTKMYVTKVRGELKNIGTADLKRIRYATRMMLLEWQTDRFIPTTLWEVVQSNKFWNKKIHGWFHSYFLLYLVKPVQASIKSSKDWQFQHLLTRLNTFSILTLHLSVTQQKGSGKTTRKQCLIWAW